MTLQEAKVFFISYGCSHFHMDREEPLKSRDYADLGIPHQLEDEWRRQGATEKEIAMTAFDWDYVLKTHLAASCSAVTGHGETILEDTPDHRLLIDAMGRKMKL